MYCRRCGASLLQGVVICPECGARQRRQASSVRCANCRRTAPIGLTVCPHCGRDLKPAGPRWGLWLAGLGLVIMISLWAVGELPVARVGQEIAKLRTRVTSLVQVLGPVAQGVTRPMQALETPQALAVTTLTPAPATTERPPAPETVIPTPAEGAQPAAATQATTPEPAMILTDTLAITGTPTSAASPPTPTVEPTATPTLTPTASPAPPTATPAPTAVAQATPARSGQATTYRIQSGDTLSGIAQRYHVTLDALLAANQLTAKSTLRIGQELVIPLPGAAIPPTATPQPRATATPTAAPTATSAPALPAPALLNPADQASYTGEKALIEMKWDAVPGMVTGNQYRVILRWVEGGVPQERPFYTTIAGMPVPPWLWGHADQPTRQYTWFVQVIQMTTDGQGGERPILLSPASQMHTFYWN